jgi:hypothetical protein
MDDITALRTDPEPAPEVTAAHRNQLLAAMGAYAGPVAGPAPDSDLAPDEGQQVQHWTSETGSIELRWPAPAAWFSGQSAAIVAAIVAKSAAEAAAGGEAHEDLDEVVQNQSVVGPEQTAAGVWTLEVTLTHGDPLAHRCQTALFTFTGAALEQVSVDYDRLIAEVNTHLTDPLVAAQVEAPATARELVLPQANGVVGGPVDDPDRYLTAAEALGPFVDGQAELGDPPAAPTVGRTGYVEKLRPDGSVDYVQEVPYLGPETGAPIEGDMNPTTLIHVVRDTAGWHVESWLRIMDDVLIPISPG